MVDKNLGLPIEQSHDYAWQQCNEVIQEWIEQGLDAASKYVIRPIALFATPTKAVSVPQQWRDTMEELAADLESEIENRRSGDLDRRIERDLIVVREARALLAEQEQGHE